MFITLYIDAMWVISHQVQVYTVLNSYQFASLYGVSMVRLLDVIETQI